jgi:hypothetical protein
MVITTLLNTNSSEKERISFDDMYHGLAVPEGL